MKLYDVVTLHKESDVAYNETLVEAASKRKRHLSAWNELADSGYLSGMSREQRTAVHSSICSDLIRHRIKIMMESGSVPDKLLYPSESEPFSMFARSPVASLNSCRKLADDFGFVIIPFEYYHGTERYKEDLNPVRRFNDASGEEFVTYIICPVKFYSPERHVRAEQDMEIYPGPFAQAFMALGMSIPLFRQLSREVVDLGNRQSRTEVRLNKVENELTNLSRRILALEESEAARQRTQFKFADKARVMAEDPLALAAPKHIGIMGDGIARIGPCWGPDFDEVLATKRGYSKQKNKKIANW